MQGELLKYLGCLLRSLNNLLNKALRLTFLQSKKDILWNTSIRSGSTGGWEQELKKIMRKTSRRLRSLDHLKNSGVFLVISFDLLIFQLQATIFFSSLELGLFGKMKQIEKEGNGLCVWKRDSRQNTGKIWSSPWLVNNSMLEMKSAASWCLFAFKKISFRCGIEIQVI